MSALSRADCPEQKRELNNRGSGFVKVNGRRRTAVSPERHETPDCVILDGGASCGVSDTGTTDFKLLAAEEEYERTGSEEILKAVVNTDIDDPICPVQPRNSVK